MILACAEVARNLRSVVEPKFALKKGPAMKQVRVFMVVIGICSLMPLAASYGADLNRSIVVSGACLRSVQPDRASINVTAEVNEKEPKQAMQKANQSYEKLRAAVQKLGLKDVEMTTSEYTVQALIDWEQNRRVFKGYQARVGLDVKTSQIARIGEVIAAAGDLNIRNIGQLQVFLSDEKMKAEREACLAEAVQNAKSKASSIAKAAGVRLGKVLIVDETNSYTPRGPELMEMSMMKADASRGMAAPSIDAGPLKVSLSVNVVYALE